VTIIADLSKNIAVLLALALVYSVIAQRWERDTWQGQVLAGLAFGGAAIIGMMTPVTLRPGLIFDGRSIVLSVAGLFGGAVPAAIAALLAAAYRLALGGTGATMGLGVTVTSAAVGACYHYWLRRRHVRAIKVSDLLILAYVVHVAMLLWTLALPADIRWETLQAVALPVLTIYPIGEVLLGLLLNADESRRRAQEALRESEARFRKFFEHEPTYCYIVSPEGTILDVNQAALAALGYQKDELVGKPLAALYAPEWHPTMEQLFTKWSETGSLRNEEAVIVTKTGERRSILLSADAVTDSAGDILHSVSVQQDITARKQAEEELHKHRQRLEQLVTERTRKLAFSESRYRQFVESPLVGIYQTDTEGRFTFVNKRLAEMTGYSQEEAPAMTLMDVVGPGQRRWLADRMQKRLAGELPLDTVEAEIVRKDGTRFTALVAPAGFFDEEGNFAGYIGALIDITERKRLEEEQRRLLNLMAGREVRMAELKEAIRQLRAQLQDARMRPVADDPLRREESDE